MLQLLMMGVLMKTVIIAIYYAKQFLVADLIQANFGDSKDKG